ncbi:hypothetical protein Agub_g1089 [Astrephomene gubernaculifera]|uniref:PhoD-like phosphatase domain-containing protein n=1 Tax=Astrephomene gubernaculifera TaxID=47775 RepID=A0AAD3HHG0_9CHLO|nr:hypothetical protein Agub_g1089 [Astrephomene gubernaculifera]
MDQQQPYLSGENTTPSGLHPHQGGPDPYLQANAYPGQDAHLQQPPLAAENQWSSAMNQEQQPSTSELPQQGPVPYPLAGPPNPEQGQQLASSSGAPLLSPQQLSDAVAGGSTARGNIRRLFGASATPQAPPQPTQQQAQQQPGDYQQQQPVAGAGTTSPERRGLLGLFGRSNTGGPPQQTPQQQGAAPPDQAAAATHQPASPQQPLLGAASSQQQALGTVPVVPPPSGLCSRPAPPVDEVARLQSSPLAASKFQSLNSPPVRGSASPQGAPLPGGAQARGNPGLAVDPAYSGPPPLHDRYGPYLRLAGYNPATRDYWLSVMMVVHQSRSPRPPLLKYTRSDSFHRQRDEVEAQRLSSYAGYNFWRWDLHLQLGPAPALVEYHVVCSADHFFTAHPRHHFHLPSAGQEWHWGFYSCNGFHDPVQEFEMRGIQPLWRDVLHMHRRNPLHVMFGGGDQLYCDDVWKVPSLQQWTSIRDKPSRNAHPFSQNMVNESFDFYFRNYTTHFGKEEFRDALACIPQVMLWDDHDIFDGWGSYPPELQNCAVFAGVYFVARKFYLLFQCHATEDTHRELNKGWGLTGLSWTRLLGGSTAVVGLDSRGERTRAQVVRPASWAAFQEQVAQLPAGVRHVVVVATVPLIYPSIPGVEEAMLALAGTGLMANALTAFLQKTGLSTQIISQFGEPELLDDLLDHWSSPSHEVEKYCLVRMMQDLAAARGFRFTLLCGDVHCAGVGCFQTMPKINLKMDHRYIPQVISSAIGNAPPPDGVIRALSASNKVKMLDAVTREKMSCIFENGTLLKAARNWCDVSTRLSDGALLFQLRVEHPLHREVHPATYDIAVPLLELPPGQYSRGPLAPAQLPPLPQPLLVKFHSEFVAAGVGLEAAQPLPPQPGGGEAQGQMQGQVQGQVHAHAVEEQQPQLPPPAPIPSPPQEQGFGLQSDVEQHDQQAQQQQQQQQLAPPPPPPAELPPMTATGSFPAIPPSPSNLSLQPLTLQSPYEQPLQAPASFAAPAAAAAPPTSPPAAVAPPAYPYGGVQAASYGYGAAAVYSSGSFGYGSGHMPQGGYPAPPQGPPPAHLPPMQPLQYPPQVPAGPYPQYPAPALGPVPGPYSVPPATSHPQFGAPPYPAHAGSFANPLPPPPPPYGAPAYPPTYTGAQGY